MYPLQDRLVPVLFCFGGSFMGISRPRNDAALADLRRMIDETNCGLAEPASEEDKKIVDKFMAATRAPVVTERKQQVIRHISVTSNTPPQSTMSTMPRIAAALERMAKAMEVRNKLFAATSKIVIPGPELVEAVMADSDLQDVDSLISEACQAGEPASAEYKRQRKLAGEKARATHLAIGEYFMSKGVEKDLAPAYRKMTICAYNMINDKVDSTMRGSLTSRPTLWGPSYPLCELKDFIDKNFAQLQTSFQWSWQYAKTVPPGVLAAVHFVLRGLRASCLAVPQPTAEASKFLADALGETEDSVDLPICDRLNLLFRAYERNPLSVMWQVAFADCILSDALAKWFGIVGCGAGGPQPYRPADNNFLQLRALLNMRSCERIGIYI